MKKSKAGIVTASVLVALLVIGVLADFLYDRYHLPTYEHGEIVSVTMCTGGGCSHIMCLADKDEPHFEYRAYKDGDGYKFAYDDGKERRVFDLSEADYTKLMRNDFNEFLKNEADEDHEYTIFEFEDGTTIAVADIDYRMNTFFRACRETFIDHKWD